jgi:lysyl-tRNA synthetase, class II
MRIPRSRRWIRIERHPQGPRVYALGRRIHEFEVGFAASAVLLAGWMADRWGLSLPTATAASCAVWLVAKDWRDIFRSRRDTGAWCLGLHRRWTALRTTPRSEGLPSLTAAAAVVVAVVNIVSAVTPDVAWRGRLLLQVEPVGALPLFHMLAVPASAGLLATAVHLRRRARRALYLAIALLVVLAALDLLKGLDFEEAALTGAIAGLLWWGRDAFPVRQRPFRACSGVWCAIGLMIGTTLLAGLAAWAGTVPHPDPLLLARETGHLVLLQPGPMRFGDELSLLAAVLGVTALGTLVAATHALLRPLTVRPNPSGESARRTARALVREHGRDTLAFFKLRRDLHYLFASDRRAFLGYAVEGRVLLVAGDPVGPDDAVRGLVGEACVFAAVHGLRVGVVGASRDLEQLWREAGLHSLYIGDEAIVETQFFTLEGRAKRKLRQAVARIDRAGYRAELTTIRDADAETIAALERVSELWRRGAPERGFAMSMDSLTGERDDGLVVLARDPAGIVRGFLHFVPVSGRAAMSLSFMRRDRATPNGLTEFLVVSAIESLRERGVGELSLNFAAFARLLQDPRGRSERIAGRLAALANPLFQIESLYRFNAKFFPRWQPRYLLYEGAFGLPRVGLATLFREGQVPRPRTPLGAGRPHGSDGV